MADFTPDIQENERENEGTSERDAQIEERERERENIVGIKCPGNVWDVMSWHEQNNEDKWKMLPH